MAQVERRLAAILAADVVGYSTLMERDEDRTLARLKAHRREFIEPLIAEHQGRVVKLMGDGALVEFASVVDAVRCAVLVQQGMAEREVGVPEAEHIRFRIGINLGDVVHEADGDLYGDGMNVAARLEQLCDPGGVVVSGTAYDHLQGKLDLPLEFTGEQRVKNIERLVRAYRVRLDGTAARLRVPSRRVRRLAAPAAAALLLLVLAAGGTWWLWPREAVSGRPSVAVLPFANLGGDEATGRLADGLTEDTITDLARYRDLDVIARNSVETYKGKPVDIRQVGKELGVGYVLEGSIQRQGDRVRVTAQLIDAGSGAHVWSERWDRPAGDVFAVQAEVAEVVANTVGGFGGAVGRSSTAKARRKAPQDLSVYDLRLLAVEAMGTMTREGADEAVRLLRRAVEVDPGFVAGWTTLSHAYRIAAQLATDDAALRQAQLEAAQRAVQLDTADANAHQVLALALGARGDLAGTKAELDMALRLSPGATTVLTTLAGWASSYDKPEQGAEAADRLVRLDPNYPPWAAQGIAYAYFMVGRYEDALRVIARVPEDAREPTDWVEVAGGLAALGRAEEAKGAVAKALGRFPEMSVERMVSRPDFAEHERRRLLETMREAGFPPCAKPEEIAKFEKPVRLPECEAERAKTAAAKS